MSEIIKGERKLLKRILRSAAKSPEHEATFNQLGIESDNYYLQRLFEHNLVQNNHSSTAFIPFEGAPGVILTPEGLHFFEFNREKLINKFLFDFIRPVSVSIVTTIVMWLLGYLFGWIKVRIF